MIKKMACFFIFKHLSENQLALVFFLTQSIECAPLLACEVSTVIPILQVIKLGSRNLNNLSPQGTLNAIPGLCFKVSAQDLTVPPPNE